MKHGRKLASWLLTLAMLLTLIPTLGGTARAVDGVSYIDADGTEKTQNNVTVITDKITEFPSGWYYVDEDVSLKNHISITGDVHIILKDGAKYNIWGFFSAGKMAAIFSSTVRALAQASSARITAVQFL